MTLLIGLVAVLVSHAGGAQKFPVPAEARALVERAITAAGGAEVLARFPAMSWNADATVHAGGRTVAITGTWKVEPPDKAIVETRPVDQPPENARILAVEGTQGWTIARGKRSPLTMEMLIGERDAFYLYAIVRALPLRDPEVKLELVPRSADGMEGLRVTRPNRPDVDVYYDAEARPRRLTYVTLDAATKMRRRPQIRLDGEIASNGVRWFKTMTIRWDDEPYFDMTLSSFQALARFQ